MMAYRELLKATNKYVTNQNFKAYLKSFYRENKQRLIKQPQRKAWIHILASVKNNIDQKIGSQKIENQINMNEIFVKHPLKSLSEEEYKQLNSTKDLKCAYNVFMMCQLFYLSNSKKVYGKKIANNQKEVDRFFKNKKKFRIDSNRMISFV